MTSDDREPLVTGPGAYPPAHSLSAPLGRWTYWITSADALVWETLPRELRGAEKAQYLGLLLMGGIGFAFLEDQLPHGLGRLPYPVGLLLTVALLHGLWILLMNLRLRLRARRRVPEPQVGVLEDWGDHLRLETGGRQRFLAPEMTRQVVPLQTHLFIDDASGLVILPLAAFDGNGAAMAAFGESWDRRSRDAAP